MNTPRRVTTPGVVLCAALLLSSASAVRAQDETPKSGPTEKPVAAPAPDQQPAEAAAKPTLEIYGFGQADVITESGQNNPDWYDVVRPSRLPSFPHEFGENGHYYVSVRQSRFGARSLVPTANGDVRATFEFDMFGVGADAGLTTIRLRHAYGQWKQVGAGQTNSQFMDVDVFPNSLDYWGPNGMLFFRNVQVFWEPYRDGDSHARIALENPGASGDGGVVADRIEIQNIKARFPAPDVTGHYRAAGTWGYVQVGGTMRYIAYDDVLTNDAFQLSGHVWGWGLAASTNLKAGENDVVRLQAIYGEGIENYFNDAPIDVAVRSNPGNAVTPVVGKALPALGLVAFVDHNWNENWSTSAGYSRVDITNSNGQKPDAFRIGQYALVNLLCTPVKNVMMGGEFQWAKRENFSDGFQVNDYRIQFSFKYNFSYKLGG
jgi:outer membrane DcaP-like protein